MISVILPTYNRANLLPRAVQSVLSQTEKDIELIVVDDASTDDTAQVMAALADPRVRYLRQSENKGACAARNAGVKAARGEYIAFQDSDDAWHLDKLEKQLAFLKSTGADMVFCAFRRFEGEDAREYRIVPDPAQTGEKVRYEQLLEENLISTQTILGKRECFVKYPFDETFPRMQDWELVLRLSQMIDIRFQPLPLADVYLQKDSISRKPQAGMKAYRKLREIHHEALRRFDAPARRFAVGIGIIAFQCGENPWKHYLSFLSPHLKPSTNLFFIRHSLQALLLRK